VPPPGAVFAPPTAAPAAAMIDWVSIVRHSRRRFSNYMYAVPNKVRRRQTKMVHADHQQPPPEAVLVTTPEGCAGTSACCSVSSKPADEALQFPLFAPD